MSICGAQVVTQEKELAFQGKNKKFLKKFIDIRPNMSIILICMDMQKNSLAVDSGILQDLQTQSVVVGAKQLRKALTKGSARRVYLADNADPALTEPLVALCQHNGVEYIWVRSMEDLGRACGIDVGAATAAVVG
jgi:large subunit ribosomal protein L7A